MLAALDIVGDVRAASFGRHPVHKYAALPIRLMIPK